MSEISNIVFQAKVSPKMIEIRLKDPIRDVAYPQRYIYVSLQKYIKDFFQGGNEPRMLGLAGLRGVGKTTLLWQLANYVYRNITTNIWFFNVNALSIMEHSIYDVLLEMQIVLGGKLNEYDEPIVFLFDEVHDDANWAKTLKILYDECRTAFVVSTGSSALLLNQTADLSARMKIEKIYPFEFTEFLMAKGVMEHNQNVFPMKGFAQKLSQGLFYSESYQHLKDYFNLHFPNNSFSNHNIGEFIDSECSKIQKGDIKSLMQEYVSYHNIPRYSLYKNKADINSGILELVKRIVYEDVAKINSKYSGTTYEKLLYRLSASDEINLEKLCGVLSVQKNELNQVIENLDKAELINLLSPYSHSIDAKITKNKKSFFMSPSIRRALWSNVYGTEIPEILKSKLWEDIIVMYLSRIVGKSFISYSSQSEGVNPDIIIDTYTGKPIVIEIGGNKTSARQIAKYNTDARYGIIINITATEPTFKDGSETLMLPLSWFLML